MYQQVERDTMHDTAIYRNLLVFTPEKGPSQVFLINDFGGVCV